MNMEGIMETDKLTRLQVSIIGAALGMGSIFLNITEVDYTRGSGFGEKGTRYIWTKDARRITITATSDGGFIASISDGPDPNIPPAQYPDAPKDVRKCVKPECENMVDLQERKSGACCRNHMNYVCLHPDCVMKAAKNGWPKYTHPYGSLIAKEHLQYREDEGGGS